MPSKDANFEQQEDSFNLIHSALLKKGKVSKYAAKNIPWHAFSKERFEKKEAEDKERKRRQRRCTIS